MGNDEEEDWNDLPLLFPICFAALFIVSELAFSFIPGEYQGPTAVTWIVAGAGMIVWGKYGNH